MSRVLVVDDSWVVRHHLAKYLEPDGHTIETAESGEEALERLGSEEFDILLLDLLMPGISGIEVLEILQEQNDQTPVIVLSADIQESTRNRVTDLGAKLFLSKPPLADDVRDAVRRFSGGEDA